MREFRKDKLHVKVCADRAELGRVAGADAADAIRAALRAASEARVIFAAAPSQNETLAALVAAPNLDWSRVVAFHMDEYVGLPIGSTARFSYYLKKHCFELVPLKDVYYIDEERNDDLPTILERYENLLQAAPIDVVVMGIGENGHVAFNDPPVADFHDPVLMKKVQLDLVCRTQQVHDGCFASLEDVPRYALTLTISALCRAAHMFCTVPAATKAQAVYDTIHLPINECVPATILRTHPHSVLYCDPDSARLLTAEE